MIRSALIAAIHTTVILVLASPGLAGIGPPLLGDFNADGEINRFDVNLLTAEIASGTDDPFLDVNLDGTVNTVDLDQWFLNYSFESGVPLTVALVDVNFDLVNTLADFQIIQANLSIATTDFTDGNLLPDGLVNYADRDLYISRGGLVPEPSAMVLTGLGFLVLFRLRRRLVIARLHC